MVQKKHRERKSIAPGLKALGYIVQAYFGLRKPPISLHS